MMRAYKTVCILICIGIPACTPNPVYNQEKSQNHILGEPSPISQPYPSINDDFFTGNIIHESPDPLINYQWPDTDGSDDLEIYTLKPVTVTASCSSAFDNLQSLKQDCPDVTVNGTGSIILDFGCINAAWIEFDSDDLSDSVEMSISEYNEPAILNFGAQNRIKTLAPVRYGNTYRLELNDELYEGVRYGWIHIRSFSKPWHIKGIRLVCQTKPVNYKGSFSCSDPALTRIWYTGAFVVKLNLLKDYFGAVLMERSDRFSWTGDAHTSQAASLVAFGNYDFVKTNINHTSTQNNGIASYSLYWVLSLIDYYNYTGDSITLASYLPDACEKLNTAFQQFGTDINLVFLGWDERLGAGFENPNSFEPRSTYHMLSIRAWYEFAKTMEKFGRSDLRDKYNQFANLKINELKQDSHWYSSFGIHAAADAINAGFTNPDEEQAMYQKEFSDRLNRLSYSPFNQYFIIQAMSRMNKYDDALGSILDCWGGQIKYGGTTFFEVYRPSWNQELGTNDAPPNSPSYTSLAHPWGAGVTKWLTEEVLGIRPTAPGFSSFDILPHLGRNLTSVSGKVPTPHGEIHAGFNVSTGECNIKAPSGTTGRIGIPKVEKRIDEIEVNGKLIWDGNHHEVEGIENVYEDAYFVYFENLQAGTYNVLVSYRGKTPSYSEPSWNYPATFLGVDSVTCGDWGGHYGSEGYQLCNYDGTGENLTSLPAFVSSITFNKNRNMQWAADLFDKRAPAKNSNNGFPRNVGCIYTNDPYACEQSFTVDIAASDKKTYQVALFFIDWDHKERRTAVEMYDLETKKLIAPVKIIGNYQGGKYLVYKYDSSVRFRIIQVRGVNATLSGIFFDI